MGDTERKTAVKITVRELLQGDYHQEEGWNPNYLELSDGRKLSRFNIIGVVTALLPEEDACYLDDGTGAILVRNYTDHPLGVLPGEFILVVGRVRDSGGQRYLSSEIARKTTPSWAAVRKKELETTSSTLQSLNSQKPKEQELRETPHQEHLTILLTTLKNEDSGLGVSVESLLQKGISESFLNALLRDGTLYQSRPGFLKLVT